MSGGLYGRGEAPARACLNLRDWPEQDRKLWLGALAPSDPFAEQGKTRAAYRLRSNHKIERSYGRWLTFLAMQGFLDCAGSPADRITPEVVHAYVRELDGLGNRKCSVLGRLQDLGEMAKVLASGRDWKFIARIAAKVRGRSEPASDKRARLVGSDNAVAARVAKS